MGERRRSRGEGRDMGGTEIRSRFERREANQAGAKMQKAVMEAGKAPDFRNRPEIAQMRQRAQVYKQRGPTGESIEAAARRLKKKMGG